jgi:hypothetical protein
MVNVVPKESAEVPVSLIKNTRAPSKRTKLSRDLEDPF